MAFCGDLVLLSSLTCYFTGVTRSMNFSTMAIFDKISTLYHLSLCHIGIDYLVICYFTDDV